jgi:hypothetical protein
MEQNNIFIALVATRFGRYDHHQDNAIQNLKKVVTCSAWDLIQLDIFMHYMRPAFLNFVQHWPNDGHNDRTW